MFKMNKKGCRKVASIGLATVIVLGLTACGSNTDTDLMVDVPQHQVESQTDENQSSQMEDVAGQQAVDKVEVEEEQSTTQAPVVESSYDSNSMIHFIDTGQSDAILIENDGHYALIDSGDTNDDETVRSYLKSQGVQVLDYLVLTHVHADHIGAADTVIKNFEVKKTFVSNDEATTKVYREYVEALANKGLHASVPLEGSVHSLGKGTLTFYNTVGNHSDTNDKSLVTYYQNGEDTALFTGDAGAVVEAELPTLDVDLYKAGHHGSSTSSSEAFVKRINPSIVAITVGEGNSYYHPHHRVVELFDQLDIPVYRTDEQGTLVFTSTGKGFKTELKPGSYNPGSDDVSKEKNEGASSGQSNAVKPNNSTNQSGSNSKPNTSQGEVKVYKNCKLLNEDYPNGINKWDYPELYEANIGRDGDRDGYACER